MTANKTTPPTAAKGRKSHRKTILSLMGITLIMAFLVVGFGQGAGNNNVPACDSMKDDGPSEHLVRCSSDNRIFGHVVVGCPFEGVNGFDPAKDLEVCVQHYGTAISLATPMTQCRIHSSENQTPIGPVIYY